MTSKMIREYLSGPSEIEQRIRSREDKIAALRSLAARVTPSLHQAPGSPGGGEDHKLENIIAKIDALERENSEDEELLLNLTLEIDDRLDTLPNINHRRVLWLYFIEHKTLDQICRELNYSKSYVMQMRHEAIDVMARVSGKS